MTTPSPPARKAVRALSRPMSRDKADTLLLIVACTLVLAPHAQHVPLWITACCVFMLIWRSWITFRGNRMPPRWILLPIAVLTVPGVYWTYDTFFGRDAGVAMLVLLLTCKLLEMRARRDLFVVVCLSFFLMLTNLFYSQSIATAALMLAATVAILTTQLSFQYTGVVPPLKQRLRLCLTMVGLALPLMLVMFFLFPRIQGPLWGLPSDAQSGHTGMSDTMAPGNIAKLALSEEIAFRAKFIDPLPERSALYWRGVVLGSYDGRTWSRLQQGPASGTITIVPHAAPVRYQVTMEPSGQRWLYALELPQALPEIPDNASSITSDLQLMASSPITDRVRYDVASIVKYSLQPQQDQLSLQDWLDLPPGFNPQTHEYAAKLRNSTDDNLSLIRTVLGKFHDEPFRYTLEPAPLGRHAVDDFLFSTRAGFCEHYASAFVVLMRALDIPARVVTGYQGGELNPVDGYLTVRQSDAHAWAEVWLSGRGWVRVDPTAAVAPDRVERNVVPRAPPQGFGALLPLDLASHSWINAIRQRTDALSNGWNQWVLNYTPQQQRNLIQSLGFERVDWLTLTLLMFALGSVVMAVTTVPLLWKRRAIDPVDALYRRLCDLLAARGMQRALHEGPGSYATRLGAPNSLLVPARQQAAIDFLKLYEATRYAPTAQPESKATRLQLLRQLKSLFKKIR
ncbi:MAG: DUF3488 domain-containing transglutaminase family protein [Herminiimonas sp.]|nr:DUF3488 domain-containing transglutaminase family protein [Herminiimonas sp.]